ENAQAELAALRQHKQSLSDYSIPAALTEVRAHQSPEGAEVSIPTSTIVALPPRELRTRSTGTGNPQSFHKTGRLSLASLEAAVASLGVKWSDFGRILDFGSGCGRLLRHLLPRVPLARIWACDVDALAVSWLQHHIPRVHARLTNDAAPLPFT